MSLEIPVLSLSAAPPSPLGSPATMPMPGGTAIEALVRVDEKSFVRALQAAMEVADRATREVSKEGARLERLTFELGVSATGKVGFLGTGTELQGTLRLQLHVAL
jgi:hypothetical protein